MATSLSPEFAPNIRPLQHHSLSVAFGSGAVFTAWRLNLIAAHGNHLFTAFGDRIFVSTITSDGTPQLKTPLPPYQQEGDEWSNGNPINSIRIAAMGGHPVLLVVDDGGMAIIYHAEKFLEYPPYRLDRLDLAPWSIDASCGSPALATIHVSAWNSSLLQQLSPTKYTVAVGSNAARAHLYELPFLDTVFSGDGTHKRNREENNEPYCFCSHQHNVPSLSLSSCGQYLATTSIDCTVRVWHVNGRLLYAGSSLEWMWCARWISRKYIPDAPVGCSPEDIRLLALRALFPGAPLDNLRATSASRPQLAPLGDYALSDESDEIPPDMDPQANYLDADQDDRDWDELDYMERYMFTSSEDEEEMSISEPVLANAPEPAEEDWGVEQDGQDADPWVGRSSLEQEWESSAPPESPDSSPQREPVHGLTPPPPLPRSTFQMCSTEHATFSKEELLVCGSMQSIYLLDGQLNYLSSLVPFPLPNPNRVVAISRVSLIEYIPELALIIASSQGEGLVCIIKIVQVQEGVYELLHQGFLPSHQNPGCGVVTGLAIRKFPNEFDHLAYYHLYVTYTNAYFSYEIRPHPVDPHLDITTRLL